MYRLDTCKCFGSPPPSLLVETREEVRDINFVFIYLHFIPHKRVLTLRAQPLLSFYLASRFSFHLRYLSIVVYVMDSEYRAVE